MSTVWYVTIFQHAPSLPRTRLSTLLPPPETPQTGLYEQCSGGKLSFVPSTGPDVVDGVLELTLAYSMVGMKIFEAGSLVRDHFNSLNRDLGIEFEAYSIILPAVVANCGGLARQASYHRSCVCSRRVRVSRLTQGF